VASKLCVPWASAAKDALKGDDDWSIASFANGFCEAVSTPESIEDTRQPIDAQAAIPCPES
jgi:hypothetical protein